MQVHHDKKLEFYAVVELMNPPPSPPVTAQIRTFHRPNPTVKNSQWVTDRKTLEESMPKHVNEIVMQETDGRLSEGLSSNFFVLKKDGTLETAADEHVRYHRINKLTNVIDRSFRERREAWC